MEQNITIENIESLVGKTIKWTSPRSSDNARYGDYTGVALIKAYVPGDYRPIKVETISGDSLEYAFLSRDKFYFAYGDDDRGIGFEEASLWDMLDIHDEPEQSLEIKTGNADIDAKMANIMAKLDAEQKRLSAVADELKGYGRMAESEHFRTEVGALVLAQNIILKEFGF